MKADLHTHSTVSDGRLGPAELVDRAAEQGVDVLALTDHDTVEGIAPAEKEAQRFPNLRFIPGVEISTEGSNGEIHILGYFIDPGNDQLEAELQKSRESRVERARRMIAKLEGLGLPVEWEHVLELASEGSIGRPHIAQAMIEKGYVANIGEAFDRYIGHGGLAYVERPKMTPAGACELISGTGGLPVLAHPVNIPDLETLLGTLQRAGLAGMEAYYGAYGADAVQHLASLARKYNLVATGGSDFHGFPGGEGIELGGVKLPPETVEKLFKMGARRTQGLT